MNFFEWLRPRFEFHFHAPAMLNFGFRRKARGGHEPQLLAGARPAPERRRLVITTPPSRRDKLLAPATSPQTRESWQATFADLARKQRT
jgi:hypothetical protein